MSGRDGGVEFVLLLEVKGKVDSVSRQLAPLVCGRQFEVVSRWVEYRKSSECRFEEAHSGSAWMEAGEPFA